MKGTYEIKVIPESHGQTDRLHLLLLVVPWITFYDETLKTITFKFCITLVSMLPLLHTVGSW